MLKKHIKYQDFNENVREEDYLFNLTKSEIMAMNMEYDGGLVELLESISSKMNIPKMLEIIKRLILDSYGEKSLDGKRFEKSEEKKREFEQSAAYDALFMELMTDGNAAAQFINGIVPKDIASEAAKAAVNDPRLASLPSAAN